MPAVITTIVPTTELEAVNTMLASIGEAQLATGTDLSTITQADGELAINILRNTAREVLTMGWKFNTEVGVEVAPTAEYSWVDTDGVTTVLNVFILPTKVLDWEGTKCSNNGDLDLIERPSKKYSGGGTQVLYDRTRNRDGAEKVLYPYLYLDVKWAFDFSVLPEPARAFIAIRAARRFTHKALGSETLGGFTQQDEFAALRDLKRSQGITRRLNMFDNASDAGPRGGRPVRSGGVGRRVFPGST